VSLVIIKRNKKLKRVFKVKEIIAILISQGWYIDRQNGTSHRQFKHPAIRSSVTVDGKLSEDVEINNLKSMERQSGLKFKDFVK
jgi:predicted RNA binding protein YcfA (HicA-like mRNA interferase family)